MKVLTLLAQRGFLVLILMMLEGFRLNMGVLIAS